MDRVLHYYEYDAYLMVSIGQLNLPRSGESMVLSTTIVLYRRRTSSTYDSQELLDPSFIS